MEWTPAGQSTPAVHDPKKLYIENKLQIVPNSTAGEVVYAFIIIRDARTNTYPMDSAHQRYRLIHYKLLYSYMSTTAHSAHQTYWLIHYSMLDPLKSTTELYTNTDAFPTCNFIGILF